VTDRDVEVAKTSQASTASPATYVGCSGWHYKHWRGDFYPSDLPQSGWFAYYASQFTTVEINNSFYRLPDRETFAAWRARAPGDFVYAVKASRYITHMKKLTKPALPLRRVFAQAAGLGATLGPVLYQLPPQMRLDIPRLDGFLTALPPRRRHVVEFRNPSWYTDEVFDTLRRHRVALCLHDMEGSASGQRVVGPFIYARFHGPARYQGRYADQELAQWAAWMSDRRRAGLPIYAYFNNDIGGHAPRDAMRLQRLLS
jgi:uncharacterized protein YecE (DUF72 family)